MQFPAYRKYLSGTSFYKIISEKEFDEIQIIGKKKVRHNVVAQQFPERLRIQDMLACRDGLWLEIDQSEFESQI